MRRTFVFIFIFILGFISYLPQTKAEILANSAWPCKGHDASHSGRSSYIGAQTNNIKWIYQLEKSIFNASPALGADGTIYIGDFDGRISAIDPENGSLKWRRTVGSGTSNSTPAIGSNGTIYIGSSIAGFIGRFCALNPDGSIKWQYQTGDDNDSFPDGGFDSSPFLGADGTIYVGSSNNNVFAFNSEDGTLKWTYKTGGSIYSSPSVAIDGTIYIGSSDKKVYALNPDGSLKWYYQTGKIVKSSPAIGSDGTVYIGSNDGKVYAFNPDGTLKWSYDTDNDLALCCPCGNCFHSAVEASPAIGADGTIYIGNIKGVNGMFYAFNPDGSLKWNYHTGNILSSPAIGADGIVYIGDDNGKVYAFNPDGGLKWEYDTEEWMYFSSPAIGDDGTVYIGRFDGNLYAFQEEAPCDFNIEDLIIVNPYWQISNISPLMYYYNLNQPIGQITFEEDQSWKFLNQFFWPYYQSIWYFDPSPSMQAQSLNYFSEQWNIILPYWFWISLDKELAVFYYSN